MRFSPFLEDYSYAVEVTPKSTNTTIRKITTRLPSTAWFTSAQALTKLKALQTDKTQSIGTDTWNQHGATNTAAALREIRAILELVNPAP